MNDTKNAIKFFKKKYGPNGVTKLKKLLLENANCQVIADEFQVTRQRAFQWKKMFSSIEVKVKINKDL